MPPLQGVRNALRLVVGQATRYNKNARDGFPFLKKDLDQHPEVVPISGEQDVALPYRELELIEIREAAPAYFMNADGIHAETSGDLRRFWREVFVEEKRE